MACYWLRSSDVSKCPKEDTVRYFNLESYGKQFHWMQKYRFQCAMAFHWLEFSDAGAQWQFNSGKLATSLGVPAGSNKKSSKFKSHAVQLHLVVV